MKPLNECRLYAFVDFAYLAGRSPEFVVEKLCQGGADLIQLRAKDLDAPRVTEIARRIVPIASAANVGLVINDFWSVAAAVGAPYCHLGQEDFFDAGHHHRSQLPAEGRQLGLGLSSHSPKQAERVVAAAADYIAIGPVFPTGTKPTAAATGLEFVRWAAANVRVPWFAIGGITLENLNEIFAAGARRICVVSAILQSRDITAACQKFKERIASAPL